MTLPRSSASSESLVLLTVTEFAEPHAITHLLKVASTTKFSVLSVNPCVAPSVSIQREPIVLVLPISVFTTSGSVLKPRSVTTPRHNPAVLHKRRSALLLKSMELLLAVLMEWSRVATTPTLFLAVPSATTPLLEVVTTIKPSVLMVLESVIKGATTLPRVIALMVSTSVPALSGSVLKPALASLLLLSSVVLHVARFATLRTPPLVVIKQEDLKSAFKSNSSSISFLLLTYHYFALVLNIFVFCNSDCQQ